MEISIKKIGEWENVKEAALFTIGKKYISGNKISSSWKKKILLCEHSPIRENFITWEWHGIKSWISVHFVRHKIGIEHFVKTQREDRTGIPRDNKPQAELVNHRCSANFQAIINISRKRLCLGQPHKETRKVWKLFLREIKEIEPELFSVAVPECIYRGFCPEFNPCGYAETEKYKNKLKEYRTVK